MKSPLSIRIFWQIVRSSPSLEVSQDHTHAPNPDAILKIDAGREAQQLSLTIGGAQILMILFVFIRRDISRDKEPGVIVARNRCFKIDQLELRSLVSKLLRWPDFNLVR